MEGDFVDGGIAGMKGGSSSLEAASLRGFVSTISRKITLAMLWADLNPNFALENMPAFLLFLEDRQSAGKIEEMPFKRLGRDFEIPDALRAVTCYLSRHTLSALYPVWECCEAAAASSLSSFFSCNPGCNRSQQGVICSDVEDLELETKQT